VPQYPEGTFAWRDAYFVRAHGESREESNLSEGESQRMSAIRKITTSPRARTVSAALLLGGVLTYAGVAGAAGTAADTTISAVGDATEGQWDKGVTEPVTIETGQSVTWSFPGAAHNVASNGAADGAENDPRWDAYAYPPGSFQVAPVGSSDTYTFYKKGTYTFVCEFHPVMTGTVVVTGADLPIPTPTPTPTVTASPTATASPSPTATPSPSGNTPLPVDDHTTTPAPTPDADTTKPTLSGIKLRAQRRAARVTFKLSENATVTVQVRKRGAKKALRTVSLQARAGTRSVVIRSSKLRKGRYTVTLTARDALGNTSTASSAALRIRR
jgi:plastocyanin